jgi:hypothetical protein
VTPLEHRKLINTLARHRVPFVIIGGHAVNYHGHQRGTQDVDAIWLRSSDAEAVLLAALREVNACWVSNEIDPSTRLEKLVPVSAGYISSNHLMMLVTDLGFLDLFDFIPGFPEVDVREVFDHSVPLDQLRCVSLDWLKRMKLTTNRPRDIDDLEQLGF